MAGCGRQLWTGVPGSLPGGPLAVPDPPGCSLLLWLWPIACQCHSELCQGEFHAGPQQAGPPPHDVPPPIPILAANFKSAQCLWSCPECSSINHRASDSCSASEGAEGTPGGFCLFHSAPAHANHKQTGTWLPLPSPSSPSSSHFTPAFLFPIRPPLPLHLTLHTPLPLVLGFPGVLSAPCTSQLPRGDEFTWPGPWSLASTEERSGLFTAFSLIFNNRITSRSWLASTSCLCYICACATPVTHQVSVSQGEIQAWGQEVPFVDLAHLGFLSLLEDGPETKPPFTT